ncbi:hypothetical protein PRIC2_014977 [Phytophthora ramorum]
MASLEHLLSLKRQFSQRKRFFKFRNSSLIQFLLSLSGQRTRSHKLGGKLTAAAKIYDCVIRRILIRSNRTLRMQTLHAALKVPKAD